MLDMQQEKKSFFQKYKLDKSDAKSSLLTKSLLWMSLGLMVIVLVTWISATNTSFFSFVLSVSLGTFNFIAVFLINIVLIFGLFLSIRSTKIPIIVPACLYVFFAIYEGFFITTILAFSGSVNLVKDLFLYMLIPAGVFAIMGLLGYFNLIDFTKFIPFVLFGSLALFIMAMVLLFTNNWYLETTYLFLAAILFIIWIGIDMQMIARSAKYTDAVVTSKKEMNRLAFMFGINLFIDFVNLLYIVIRFFGRD